MISAEDMYMMREMSGRLAKLDEFIEKHLGGKPDQVVVGKSVVLSQVIDIMDLCDIVGGRWAEWANKIRDWRADVQKKYDARVYTVTEVPGIIDKKV